MYYIYHLINAVYEKSEPYVKFAIKHFKKLKLDMIKIKTK